MKFSPRTPCVPMCPTYRGRKGSNTLGTLGTNAPRPSPLLRVSELQGA